jgi:RNA polymerase sigma-70 factor (ECF subfamily)
MNPMAADGRPLEVSFETTRWSVVLAAGRPADDATPPAELAELCQAYWPPLYAYVRRRSGSVESAQDLTQEFFLRLLQKGTLVAASPERGRFRAFLLTSVKNFLANERERTHAQRRGGGRLALSLDWESVDSRRTFEPVDESTPERRFEREWAVTLLERVVQRLQDEFVADGRARAFDVLKPTLTGDAAPGTYDAVSLELGCSADAARQAAHRLKKRYRELLRDEVAQTVARREDVDDEIRSLFATFGD